jgi:hypothetical protein
MSEGEVTATGVVEAAWRTAAVLFIAVVEVCALIAMYRTEWEGEVRLFGPWVVGAVGMGLVLPWKRWGVLPVVLLAGLVALAAWLAGLGVWANRWGT